MNELKVKKKKLTRVKLDTLLEVTRGINKNLKAGELFRLFETVLETHLELSKFALFNYKERWSCPIAHNDNGEAGLIHPATDLEKFTEPTIIHSQHPISLQGFDILVPVLHKELPLAYLLIGGLDKDKVESYFDKNIDFLQTLTNIITVATENKKLYKENIKQEMVRHQLQLAAELQGMLLPAHFPNNERIEIDAMYNSHDDIGGDYYDFFILPDNEIAFCIADVSGKGIPAALLMSNFQATIRVLSGFKTSLSEMVNELNTRVMASAKGEKFITLFLAKYNLETRTLTYINAGHNPPVMINGSTINYLHEGSIGLGMFDELPKLTEGKIVVEPDSVLVCYTDGVVEAEDEEGNQFGMHNLTEVVQDNASLNMQELNAALQFKLEKFKGERNFTDDAAVLSCKFR